MCTSTPSPAAASTPRASASFRPTTSGMASAEGTSGATATSTVTVIPPRCSDPAAGACPMIVPSVNSTVSTPTAATASVSSPNSAVSCSASQARPTRSGISTESSRGGSVGGGALGGGGGRATASMPSWAAIMISRHIWAGYVPPVTLMSVVGGSMGICASGKPTQTAAARCGVYPTKVASA